jgi:hypothetical protein
MRQETNPAVVEQQAAKLPSGAFLVSTLASMTASSFRAR